MEAPNKPVETLSRSIGLQNKYDYKIVQWALDGRNKGKQALILCQEGAVGYRMERISDAINDITHNWTIDYNNGVVVVVHGTQGAMLTFKEPGKMTTTPHRPHVMFDEFANMHQEDYDNCSTNGNYTSPTSAGLFMQDRQVNPLDPSSFEPALEEIFTTLPQMNRYGGHTPFPYSVAQHSVYCTWVLKLHHNIKGDHYALYTLLHDAPEAYLQDIVRPLKRFWPDAMLEAEDAILENILRLIPFSDDQRTQLEQPTWLQLLKEIDNRMCSTEMDALFNIDNPLEAEYPTYNMEIIPWTHEYAYVTYRNQVLNLLEKLYESK